MRRRNLAVGVLIAMACLSVAALSTRSAGQGAYRGDTPPSRLGGEEGNLPHRPLQRIKPPIHDWLIPYGPKRRREMGAYSKRHYGKREWRLRRVELIVKHLSVTPTVSAVYNTFARDSPDPEFGELPGVCSHYVIDRSGRIYRLVPLGIRCRHVVGLNHLSIGIEHVGRRPTDVLDNPQQLHASLRLTRWLRCRFDVGVRRVIGHAESLSSPFYRELQPAFRGQTHGDWSHRAMRGYRKRLSREGACP